MTLELDCDQIYLPLSDYWPNLFRIETYYEPCDIFDISRYHELHTIFCGFRDRLDSRNAFVYLC